MLWASASPAEAIRPATFAAPLSRDGPRLLLRDILGRDDPAIGATTRIIASVQPDIILLTDFDFDADRATLDAFAESLGDSGMIYPHRFSIRPNAGMATGMDMDGNGRLGEARAAQGYGRFAGQGGLAILSRWPVDMAGVTDLGPLLWRELPGAVLATKDGQPFPSAEVQAVQRLSSTGHWIVPINAPGGTVTLMVWSATPPVFEGPEDLNSLRNRDELALWRAVLDGTIAARPEAAFVLMGNSNLDPVDGDGISAAMADPRLQDPRPQSEGGRAAADQDQSGDPALDTADWPDGAPGNLRVSYILPSAEWVVRRSGVVWPGPDDPDAATLGTDVELAGPHRLVWADLDK